MRDRRRRLHLAVLAVCLAVVAAVAAVIALDRPGAPADFGPAPAAAGRSALPQRTAPPSPAAPAAPAGRFPVRVSEAPPPAADPPRPLVLAIPRLGVRAPVEAVGVGRDGQVAVPGNAEHVGWYRFGAAPGSAAGSAVVVGHVDSRTQGLGVLAALGSVRAGDRVTVALADRRTLAYRVVSRRSYDKAAVPLARLFRRDGPPVLTLITCTAPFDPARGGYLRNLVVTAVRTGV
ncbi:class F sortase [Streptomyces sp. NPDC001380]|uniref:class F sortase n=1 Tax=Streptomyces sp. NPDC001380 TaxID=3364566 RepID=UPI0036CAC34F